MKRWVVAFAATILVVAVTAAAEEKKDKKDLDLSKPKATVDQIRTNDPPSVSTGTKPSSVGVPADEFKPKVPSVHPKEPPAPADKKK